MNPKERPETVAGMLQWVIKWLDDTDQLLAAAYPDVVEDFAGREVQEDLQSLVYALQANPQLEQDLWRLAFKWDVTE